MANRKYSQSERAEIVRLVVDEGRPIASVARQAGVGNSTVKRWIELDRSHSVTAPNRRPGRVEPDDRLHDLLDRIHALEVRIGRLDGDR